MIHMNLINISNSKMIGKALASLYIFVIAIIGNAYAEDKEPGRDLGAVLSKLKIPDGPAGDSILMGKNLLSETRLRLPQNVKNGLNCTNCHLKNGTVGFASPWVGLWGVFPEYRSRNASVITLADRINDCFERSMNGVPLPSVSEEMNVILAYMQWISSDVPAGTSIATRGLGKINKDLKPDPVAGKFLYAQKCAACHGLQGEGVKTRHETYLFPPLWGDHSFNDGAGMARTYTAAAFIRYNMPLGAEGTLTDQEAIDIAEFFTHQPRPIFAKKASDWSKGDKPKDARN